MKKKIIIIILIICALLLVLGIYIIIRKNELKSIRNNIKIKYSDNLNIEYGSIHYLSEFISIENGSLIDLKIKYDNLGELNIEYTFLSNNKTTFKDNVILNVVDTTKPVVMMGNSMSLYEGYEGDIAYSIVCGDNYDKKPKCVVEGDYDINTPGKYNLTYIATDSNNNENKFDFTLTVKEKSNKKTNISSEESKTLFSDIVSTFKTDSNKIGIDVSRWQGDVEWDKVINAGVEFVMIRIGYQDSETMEYKLDKSFIDNITALNSMGIDVGLYFYSYASTEKEAIKQANWILNEIKDYKVSLPIVFDWECWDTFNKLNISLTDITKVQEAFLDTINSKGYKSARYGSKSYLNNLWQESLYPTWLAHYTSKTDYDKEYFMWQLCNNGVIEGINGYVDIDILYN